MKAAILDGFRNWAHFQGRASRPQFWWWVLFTFLAGMPFTIFDELVFPELFPVGPAAVLFELVVLIPTLAVTARRLHDIGRSGWWQVVWHLPTSIALPQVMGFSIGVLATVLTVIAVVVMVAWWVLWLVRSGDPGPNRHGPLLVLPPRQEGQAVDG